jgi:hypothetical protein
MSKDNLWTPESTEAYIRSQWTRSEREDDDAMKDSDTEAPHFDGEGKRMTLKEIIALSLSSPIQWNAIGLCLSYLSSLKLADACISAQTFYSYDPLMSLGAVAMDCQTLRNLSVLGNGKMNKREKHGEIKREESKRDFQHLKNLNLLLAKQRVERHRMNQPHSFGFWIERLRHAERDCFGDGFVIHCAILVSNMTWSVIYTHTHNKEREREK